LTAYQSVHR